MKERENRHRATPEQMSDEMIYIVCEDPKKGTEKYEIMTRLRFKSFQEFVKYAARTVERWVKEETTLSEEYSTIKWKVTDEKLWLN